MTQLITAETLTDALAALAREAKGNTVVFCEDRLTLLAERAVLEETGGTFETEVTTFARFLSGERRVLSKEGSVMKLAALIEAHADELVCFGKGAAQAVYETIAQLSASRVEPEMLRREETDGLLREKLNDLALLYEAYRDFLNEEGLVDENGYLALLPEAMRALRGRNAVFFAFPSFTRQALEGLRAAITEADRVTGIFVDGGAAFCTHEAPAAFLRTAEQLGPVEKRRETSALSGEARTLYKALFAPAGHAAPVPAKDVCLFEAADIAEETDTVCALIKRGVAEGARYREFSVLIPDASYFPAIEKSFSAYRIPYFMDKKRAFSEHPFSVFCLSLLGAVADGVLPDSADAVAASVYFGEGGDSYRNYLLKFGGYRGAVRREIKGEETLAGFDRAVLVSCRERMLALLKVFPQRGKGETFAAGIGKLMELTGAEEVTAALAAHVTGAEREFLSLAPLERALSEIVAVAGGETFSAREFSALLASGLSALTVSMLPQSADSVLVGDATETLLVRTPTVFVLGLTDALPRVSRDTALISDKEIRRLAALSVEIEPAIAVVNARARESLANNLCAFEKKLYLSRPVKNGDGETVESEALSYLKNAIIPAPIPAIFPYNCSEEGPAFLALLRYRERGEKEEYASLFHALSEAVGRGRVEALLAGGKPAVPETEELYFKGDVSPTLLEAYFGCPYAGFLSRALHVRERQERTVQDTDAGTFIHALLERVAPAFQDYADEAACRAAAAEAAKELLADARFSSLGDTAEGSYLAARLTEEGVSVAAEAWRQIARSKFRVRETETELSLPELHLRGRADRVDEADDYVRVIDYKTGEIDDSAVAYYTGRKLQLQLYLLAAAEGKKPAGAFYFGAGEQFSAEGKEPRRMQGFFSDEEEVLSLMDTLRGTADANGTFENTGRSKRAMKSTAFGDFLAYARLVSAQAEQEMKEGNIAPSPYEGACEYCKFKGACGFVGEARKEEDVSCPEIAAIAARGEGRQ